MGPVTLGTGQGVMTHPQPRHNGFIEAADHGQAVFI